MQVSLFLRNKLTDLPLPVGQLVAKIPFGLRPGIGSVYRERLRDIHLFDSMNIGSKKEWIFDRVLKMVQYAYAHVPFYRAYYSEKNFSPDSLRTFDDIARIPIINKCILQNYDLDFRSSAIKDRHVVNTGGSSGRTLALYVQACQMGTEWAHMHTIWNKLGYTPKSLKLMFGGRSNIKNGIQYDFVRHSMAVNIYEDFEKVRIGIERLLADYKIEYLHGYPSAIYEFALSCRDRAPNLIKLLTANLKGVFFSSEYPMPRYRQLIENVFCVPSVSWYGHTERAMLAYERYEQYIYHPFQTYGFAELVPINGQNHNLVCTSYYNFASPLIRYDTEDQTTAARLDDGVLVSFEIGHGRSGQFIVDLHGKNIPLTGMIFGRHHPLFDYCSHIQIYQPEPGKAIVLFVPINKDCCSEPNKHFDSNNVRIEFFFELLNEPIRSTSGKINLLVTDEDLQRNNVSLGRTNYENLST